MTAKDRLQFRVLKRNPKKRKARRVVVRVKRRTRAARNPKQKYIIAADVGRDTTYFDGKKSFLLSRGSAKAYTADKAAAQMQKMLPKLPPSVRAIRRVAA